jgi:hypothetical protein
MRNATILTLLIQLITVYFYGQAIVVPGDPSIDLSLLKSDNYSMSYSVKKNGSFIEIGEYHVIISNDNQKFDIKTTLSFHHSESKWKGHFVSNAHNLKPISSSDINNDRTITLNFTDIISGSMVNTITGKKTNVKEENNGNFFHISVYPFLIRTLPLTSGYKAIIPVFDFDETKKNKFCNVIVTEVKSDLQISKLTGEHKVWKVSTYEECSKHSYQFYIDKVTRRIWQINIVSAKGDNILLVNKENDFNPFKNKFDREATLKLINNGSATIEGVAFAKDNENEGLFKGMAVLNINKKQYAPKGTTVVLMPNTEYFKEWIELNKKQEKIKNTNMIPLPSEAFDCLKFTTIYDDKGHFEFTNLMKGSYLLSTSFGYTHTSKRSEVTGTSDVYYGGNYVGSNVYTSVFSYNVGASANIQKIVTINDNNETVKVKLKKTR